SDSPAARRPLPRVAVAGNIQGGAGYNSGVVGGSATIDVSVGGSLIGGAGDGSGQIASDVFFFGGPAANAARAPSLSASGDLGDVRISGDIRGGTGGGSGVVHSTGAIARLTVSGSLLGGDG